MYAIRSYYGGPDGRKFMKKNMRQLLLQMAKYQHLTLTINAEKYLPQNRG